MSDALRIVHVLPALTKGGAERVAVDLANASSRTGHQVTVVTAWKVDEQILRVRLDPEVCVIYMTEKLTDKFQRYCAGLGWVMRNRAWLLRQDVLHLHLTHAAVFGTILYVLRALRRGTGPAIVETYHAVGMKIPNRMRAFHAWNCRRRDALAVMALDPFWREFIARNPTPIARLIPNGVDAQVGAAPENDVRACLDRIGVPRTARRIIGTVGQFRADRQPRTLARILIDVLKQTPDDVHALMCGSGPELEAVRQIVAEAGLSDRFTLPGIINEPRLAMSAMAIYLTINVGPITGIAALEAAFCSLPIIALQLDPSSEPAAGDWIWSTAEPAALSRRTVALLADPDERIRIGTRQHAHAIAEYSADSMYRKYIDLYRQVLNTRQAATISQE